MEDQGSDGVVTATSTITRSDEPASLSSYTDNSTAARSATGAAAATADALAPTEGLSTASTVAIGVGVSVTVAAALIVLYMLFIRRHTQQTLPTNDDQFLDQQDPSTVVSQTMDLKEGDILLEPPSSYPYEKATPNLGGTGTATSIPDTSSRRRSQFQHSVLSFEPSQGPIAGFYAPSKNKESSSPTQYDPDINLYHDKPEIDGNPVYEAPESSKQHKEMSGENSKASKVSLAPSGSELPRSIDLQHLSKNEPNGDST
ncbi:MAG: hypothetical protein Q9168_003216 [Polycauliona sp. 1 TL-2023]